MVRKCKYCGVEFTPQTSDQYMCADCREKALSDNAYRRVKCWSCGKEFDGYIRSRYCPECAAERRREADRRRRKNGTKRKIGSVDYCEMCGKEYIVVGGLQRYCPDCAEIAKKEYSQKQKHDWYFNKGGKEKHIESRARLKTEATVCPVCGKSFTATPENRYYCSLKCAHIAADSDVKFREINRDPASQKLDPRSKTGVRGVHWSEQAQRFIARISVNGVRYCLGSFTTLEEAAKARKDAEAKYYNEEKNHEKGN